MISPEQPITNDLVMSPATISDTSVTSMLSELPANATNAQALPWVSDMRRLLDRWETLPEHDRRSMTPAAKQRTYDELDKTEDMIRRNMV